LACNLGGAAGFGCLAPAGSRIADLGMACWKYQRSPSVMAGEMENDPSIPQPVSHAVAA